MWFASFSGLVLMPALLATAWPIRVHQPTAVTSPPPAQLTAEQIDYLLKHYIGTGSTNAPRLVLTPPHHDYVPIDSAFIKSTNPKLRQPASAASGLAPAITKLEEHSNYFVPTIRPYDGGHTPSGYDFYFPQADDVRVEDDAASQYQAGAADLNLTYLRNMQPPAQPTSDEEPNYYAALKMSGAGGGNKKALPKKFNSTKKQVNLNGVGKASVAKLQAVGGRDEVRGDSVAGEDEYNMYVGQASHQEYVTRELAERLTPKSAMRTLRAEELNTGEYLPSVLRNGNANGNRIAYQMHGFNGPQSYRFGYDTGKGENRQFRVEQRDKDGNVIGEYGYYDGLGKMNVFKYTSRADEGFQSKKVL